MNKILDANAVVKVARAIAGCDFRVTVSRYVSGDGPWMITVGESNWTRGLVVKDVSGDGDDAELGLLSSDEDPKIERTIMLSDLVSSRYIGVRQQLRLKTKAA